MEVRVLVSYLLNTLPNLRWLFGYAYLHCAIERHEDILGSGGIAPPFLTSALYGGE
jgi:hypothetical protein